MDRAKRAAGRAAIGWVEDDMLLGLGTGSTVAYFLDALTESGLRISGVPTSEWTAARCRELGIGLLTTAEVSRLDLVVDGADELDHDLTLVKGGGGALLREKVVASMADRMLVIATQDKLVERLADGFPLPVEVVPFAVPPVTRRLQDLGFEVIERHDDGVSYRTDNGNAILQARAPGGLEDPAVAEVTIGLIPGVAGSGLFVDLASIALLGDDNGEVTQLTAPSASA